jgi:hypothetical protein
MCTDRHHCDGSTQALGVIAPPQEEAVATENSTSSAAASRVPGKVTAYPRVVEGESYRQRHKTRHHQTPAQTDAVATKK